ncbi:thermonuclease family protein [Staphylococcus auricularis]|nr:thermonuclease family protein [Staphylococcus auricularis]
MWIFKKWNLAARIIISLIFFIVLIMPEDDSKKDVSDKEQVSQSTAKQQEDSKESEKKDEENEHSKSQNKTNENSDGKDKDGSKNNSKNESTSKDTDENKKLNPGTTDRIPVELTSTVDGDTAKFKYNGKEESFRFLLIDTPETKHPRVGKQPFGQEASDRTSELLNNANDIKVEFDVGEKKDKYGRYLGYIYVDGEMLNNILVREGLAKVAYVYPPNTRHLDTLEESQEKAKEEEIGIWSLDSAFEDDNSSEDNDSSNKNSEDSESNNSNSGTENNSVNNESSIPDNSSDESFPNCIELREVYPEGVPQNHPAYEPKHDRDNDGYACEVN